MHRIIYLTLVIGFMTSVLAPAHAQATRTWISGVGDDANPCSRTAPCKTFAGAISKTAGAGEINCLDPGGFGGVTITKAITLNCHEVFGSVLVGGTAGIIINAGAADNVIIRNLQIQGIRGTASPGTIGIRILAAGTVSIEDSVITQFAQQGIADVRTGGGTKLFVKGTTVSHNGGAGIAAAGAATNTVVLDNVYSINNRYGIAVATGNNVVANRSVFSGNSTAGIESDPGGQLVVDNSVISHNSTGVLSSGPTTVRLSNNDISFNSFGITGATTSFGNNRIYGNSVAGTAPTPAGAATSAVGQQ